MNKKLVIEIKARIDWQNPPYSKQEELMRERANIIAQQAADNLNAAVSLLVLELINAKHEI